MSERIESVQLAEWMSLCGLLESAVTNLSPFSLFLY